MQRETFHTEMCCYLLIDFNPLPLCRGRLLKRRRFFVLHYFNPLPLCRGRQPLLDEGLEKAKFQSSPSMQRETRSSNNTKLILRRFQSSPSMQRETALKTPCIITCNISILSLYAEGDCANIAHGEKQAVISILSLYAEGDIRQCQRLLYHQ